MGMIITTGRDHAEVVVHSGEFHSPERSGMEVIGVMHDVQGMSTLRHGG